MISIIPKKAPVAYHFSVKFGSCVCTRNLIWICRLWSHWHLLHLHTQSQLLIVWPFPPSPTKYQQQKLTKRLNQVINISTEGSYTNQFSLTKCIHEISHKNAGWKDLIKSLFMSLPMRNTKKNIWHPPSHFNKLSRPP